MIKVAFVDFCPDFNANNCRLFKQLSPHFPLEISNHPDYLFFSVFGVTHCEPKFDRCIKILCITENIRPNFSVCDYSLSCDYLSDPRNLRLPYYSEANFYLEKRLNRSLVKDQSTSDNSLAAKSKFCNFVYSNGWAKERIAFFELLSKYKKVDSGGKVKNNLGFQVGNKLDFMPDYKFTIAFENSSYPGYVTEKLIEPMLVNSIPIYWGSPRVVEEFNPRSFISCHEYPNWQSAVERIIEIDLDDSLYLQYLKEPWLHGNKPNIYCQSSYLIPFFQKVFDDKVPRSSRPVVKVSPLGCNPHWEIII
jgi:hypothetical protein